MLFWFTLGVVALMIVIWISVVRAKRNFLEKWPAIDDDEFLRRCAPGTPRAIALGVRRMVSKHLNIPYEHIYPEQSFIDDLDV